MTQRKSASARLRPRLGYHARERANARDKQCRPKDTRILYHQARRRVANKRKAADKEVLRMAKEVGFVQPSGWFQVASCLGL